MKLTTTRNLGILLAAQLGLALLLTLSAGEFGTTQAGQPLLSFEPDDIQRVRIRAPGQDPVVLQKRDEGWLLPDYYGVPASSEKVQEFLVELKGLEKRLPLTTSAAAKQRFKVADDKFERVIELYGVGEEPVARLYLGDSPGFRRIYGRAGDDDTVFELAYGAHQASAKSDDWADRNLLRLPEDELTRVEMPGVTLERADDAWRVADLQEGEQNNEEEIRSALQRLSGLGFLSIQGTEPPAGQPVLELKVARKTVQPVNYRFYPGKDGGDPQLRSSAHPWTFTVAKYLLEDLQKLTRDKLVKRPPEAAEAGQPPPEPTAAPAQ
jgi:hypothetical protein